MDGLARPPVQAVPGLPFIKTCFFLAALLAWRSWALCALLPARPARPSVCPASCAKLTTRLCSPAARPPAPQGSPGGGCASWGRLPLRVFTKAHAPCVARAGPVLVGSPFMFRGDLLRTNTCSASRRGRRASPWGAGFPRCPEHAKLTSGLGLRTGRSSEPCGVASCRCFKPEHQWFLLALGSATLSHGSVPWLCLISPTEVALVVSFERVSFRGQVAVCLDQARSPEPSTVPDSQKATIEIC